MTGKTVLVTGATNGIGYESARVLAGLGAHVIVGARDATRGSVVVDELRALGGNAELLHVDLASLESIERAAERVRTEHAAIDVLVNNAGIIAAKRRTSVDGHELTWATNFLGLVALTRALQPQLESAPEPRIVNVGSAAHANGKLNWDDLELEHGYSGLRAYAQSKLAVNLWTREFARRFPAIATNAVHPGAIGTNIWGALPAFGQWIVARILPPASKGAGPIVRLASSDDVAGVTGRYFDKLVEKKPAPAALVDADAARLWTYAETTVG